jgi:hypothetical protein
VVGQQPGGSLASRWEFFVVTYETPYGESAPSGITGIDVNPDDGAVITAPALVSAATPVNGWNVYGLSQSSSVAPPLADLEKLNAAPLPLWAIMGGVQAANTYVEPNTGIPTGGGPPPTGWAYTLLNLRVFPNKIPAFSLKVNRTKTRSYAGFLQAFEQFQDNFLEFEMPRMTTGADVAAWDAFLTWAAGGGAFDYYPNGGAPGGAFTSYWWIENDDIKASYKSPGWYEGSFKFTQAIF